MDKKFVTKIGYFPLLILTEETKRTRHEKLLPKIRLEAAHFTR
jgi:hypothetical protein